MNAIQYLGGKEVADHIGVKRSTINNYNLPEPDAVIGRTRGWLSETIDKWNANRPGRGNWNKNK